MIALGIDTGGTYTDAVLVDQDDQSVLAAAKALTTYYDLAVGIGQAVADVLAQASAAGRLGSPSEIGLVSLSTTLATNAIVEGRGCPIALLLVGYNPELIHQYGFEHDLVTRDVVYIAGGHDGDGNEAAPLDEAAARTAILEHRDRVEAFAVSGYFSVRNPAHEMRVRALVEELTADHPGGPLPVTCGHELTDRLNAVRRATTTALNARLIPLLRELIGTLRGVLNAQDIHAPLMVVKGDGSLVRADWAMQRPIETILAGPAASVVGASHLAGRGDMWVLDMGGTTTDIAALRDGRPRLSPEGARVGGWRTMVEAVDVHTVGLGGDSRVEVDRAGHLSVGPRRVVPLCLLAAEHPGVVEELRSQAAARPHDRYAGQFVLAQRRSATIVEPAEQAVLDDLARGPQALAKMVKRLGYGLLVLYRLEDLEGRRLLLRSAFTPTDALHVLGRFRRWDVEAARLGAELLAGRYGASVEAFCERVVAEACRRAATELVAKALGDEGAAPRWDAEPAAAALLAHALDGDSASALECQIRLRQPLVAIGAPVAAYLPTVAELLHTDLLIPAHADVANAVGAVAGAIVVQELRVAVRPLGGFGDIRLHLPTGVCDFGTLADAIAHAEAVMPAQVETLAHRAGADQVEVRMSRRDLTAPVAAGWGEEMWLETELAFTAVGRPSLVAR